MKRAIMTWSKVFDFSQDINADNDSCLARKNTTIIITSIYEGIPETLILNLISWIVLVLLFAILRNHAWDYGRLALVHNSRWTQLFYKNTENLLEESNLDNDSGCCSWLPTIFRIDKRALLQRCGPDAAHYLSFQRHLLTLSFIITLFSICIILPINFQGTLQGGVYTFGHTTLSNLEPNSQWLWVHVIASFCFVPLTVLIMRRCSSRIPSSTPLSSCTVMVTHISRTERNPDVIRSYFMERYPNVEIKDVQMAYRIKQLTSDEEQREWISQAKSFCVGKRDIKVQPHGCICCCRCNTRDALDYYTCEEKRLNDLVAIKRREALQSPLGIAFLTVGSEDTAQYINQSFVPGTRWHWFVAKAPPPSDIFWENLEISSKNWYSKAICINFMLFIVLFFLTTPAIVVNILNSATFTQAEINTKISPVISEFLPTLLLLTLSALMPVVVAYSDQWMSHWTKSKQNLATMQKTFYFLLFMVLILPSLGLTSAQALVEWSVQSKNHTYRWQCIFLPDKGAFFINYVITSSLIGTGLELLRFPELAMYIWRLMWAKSEAERPAIQKVILAEFPFGIHYAWISLIFTVSTVYSIICPLITPFGFLYLILKHLVDKHNIYFVYRPSSMLDGERSIHSYAVRNVRVGVILLQALMAAFAIVRGGFTTMSIVTLMGLFSTMGFFFMLGPFPTCRPKSAIINNYAPPSEKYVAPVLITSSTAMDNVVTNQPRYGSSGVNELSSHVH